MECSLVGYLPSFYDYFHPLLAQARHSESYHSLLCPALTRPILGTNERAL